MATEQFDNLLQFFKVLGNESRLKILGLLANQAWSVGELAQFLELKEPTVSHHLSAMKELGLVHVQAEGNTRIYTLDTKFLETMSKDIFSQAKLATLVKDASADGWEAKVRKAFIKDGRLIAIPSRQKKKLAILNWIVQKIERDRRYPEQELNQLLNNLHPDHASLRRYLVDFKLMQRERGIYWRIDDLE
ncbi:MAG: metalloregulator ArsR/SmtB family transcription factor [Chloroflexi bacterium]|nr:metalloregulator ArsR/SmtB family transcription factor [Chloroflexota bacterium]